MWRKLIPYLWAVPLCALSWAETHDQLARGLGLYLAYTPVTWAMVSAGYIASLIACSRKLFSVHQLGHLVVFELAALVGFRGSDLQCIVGIIYFYIIVWTGMTVIAGAVLLAAFNGVLRITARARKH